MRCAQKGLAKVRAWPLSAVRVHVVALPAKVTCSRRKRAWLLITAPVRRWHARQWHMEMRDGSPSIAQYSYFLAQSF